MNRVCLSKNLWRGLAQTISLRANEQLGLCAYEREFMENNVAHFTSTAEAKLGLTVESDNE